MADNYHKIQTWSPKEGEELIGIYMNSATGLDGARIFKIKDDAGTFYYLYGTRMLTNIMNHLKSGAGTKLKIKFDGFAQSNWSGGTGHPYKHFTIEKEDLCPECGSTIWRDVVPQQVTSPKYIKKDNGKETNNLPTAGRKRQSLKGIKSTNQVC